MWTNVIPAYSAAFTLTTGQLGLLIRVLAGSQTSNTLGPVVAFVEVNPGTDSYQFGFFRDNGRNQYSVENELWTTPVRRTRGRRVR